MLLTTQSISKLKGLIADKTSMVDSFYFSGLCFVIGLALTSIVSFSTVIERLCGKSKSDLSTDTQNKTGDESELNKNLLSSKAQTQNKKFSLIKLNLATRIQTVSAQIINLKREASNELYEVMIHYTIQKRIVNRINKRFIEEHPQLQ